MSSSHQDYYREQRARADIGAIAREMIGSDPASSSGADLCFGCPRHSSKSGASLKVSTDKGLWQCFGCKVGGDALQLVEFIAFGVVSKGKVSMTETHRQARDQLARMVGMEPMASLDLSPEERAEVEARHQEREEVLDALDAVTELYHQDLLENDEVLKWIRDKYGFDRDQVEQFKIGWAGDPRAARRLQDQGLDPGALTKTGAFKEANRGWLRPFFDHRVVFPYIVHGRAVYLIGRQTPWTPDNKYEGGKYKKLPVHDPVKRKAVSQAVDNSTLWGEGVLTGCPGTVLITEGITDAMAATAAGVPTISPVTVRLKHDDFERLIPRLQQLDRVVLILDNELSDIGHESAMALAEHLRARGVAAFVAELPLQEAQETARAAFAEILGEELTERFLAAPSKERAGLLDTSLADRPDDLERALALREQAKIDVCEWFRGGGTREQFRELMASARSPVEIRIDQLEEGSDIEVVKSVLPFIASESPLQRECLVQAIKSRTKLPIAALRDELKPMVKETAQARVEHGFDDDDESGPTYESTPDGLFWVRQTKEGPIRTQLANFQAEIIASVIEDDGIETTTSLELEARIGRVPMRFSVPGRSFSGMGWSLEHLGSRAILSAGMAVRDHARAAIQTLSPDAETRRVYTHTGWRQLDGVGWCYLHAGGAIGPEGPVISAHTRLHGSLERYKIPEPPGADQLAEDFKAHMRLLELGPDRIMFPLVSAIWRSVLTECDFAIHTCGESGAFKTEVGALIQSHWGPELDSRHVPASWSSTGNSLEVLAFGARHAILLVDDFAPTGSSHDVQRYHREADRIFRAQGNRSGRGRLRADGTLRATKYPRGLIFSTGEDIPVGQSLRARLLVIEISPGEITGAALTECQRAAREGAYARTMAAFLQWLSVRLEGVVNNLAHHINQIRERAAAEDLHRRTPGMVAHLSVGFELLLTFAEEGGLLTPEECKALQDRCWSALIEAAAAQARYVTDSEPTTLFFQLLASALASGEAHIASARGHAPQDAQALGWRMRAARSGNQEVEEIPHEYGARIGWIDGDDLYLELDASFKAAQKMASETSRLTITTRTLCKRLSTRGLLKTEDYERGKHTIRHTLESSRRTVLHLDASTLLVRAQWAHRAPKPHSQPPTGGERPNSWARNGSGADISGPRFGPNPDPGTAAEGGQDRDGPIGPEISGGRPAGEPDGEEKGQAAGEVSEWTD